MEYLAVCCAATSHIRVSLSISYVCVSLLLLLSAIVRRVRPTVWCVIYMTSGSSHHYWYIWSWPCRPLSIYASVSTFVWCCSHHHPCRVVKFSELAGKKG